MNPFTASDLPIDESGRIYHLNVRPDDIAPDVIIVGDPDRAAAIAGRPMCCFGGAVSEDEDPVVDWCNKEVQQTSDAFLREVECDFLHRGLRTITGRTAEGQRVTVTTSGMGTPSLEIVLRELFALQMVDFNTRTERPNWEQMNIIRVGTSGALRETTELGTAINTKFAVGFDNSGLFYNVPGNGKLAALEVVTKEAIDKHIPQDSRFAGRIWPYASSADDTVFKALSESAEELGVPCKAGITASCSGFFGNQGRPVPPLELTVPEIDAVLDGLNPDLEGLRFENMEMEASLLLHLACGAGHRAGAFCLTIANRRLDTFDNDYEENVLRATRAAFSALAKLRRAV